MSFSSNPFFSNNTLRRCMGADHPRVHLVTTDIQWNDTAHKLTVKVLWVQSIMQRPLGHDNRRPSFGVFVL